MLKDHEENVPFKKYKSGAQETGKRCAVIHGYSRLFAASAEKTRPIASLFKGDKSWG